MCNFVNKALAFLLGVLLLNLAREYAIEAYPNTEILPENYYGTKDFIKYESQKKDWNYYGGVFGSFSMPSDFSEISLDKEAERLLQLKGTVVGNALNSFAIIEDIETRTQDLYKLNETVGDIKVVAVGRDNVSVEYKGQKMELRMIGDEDIAAARDIEEKPDEVSSTQESIDFSRLLTQMRIRPYFQGGVCAGYELISLEKDLIDKTGLKVGDIIESINSAVLDDPLKSMQVIYGVKKGDKVVLEVRRNSETINVEFVV
jgi:type II secretion system protein C